MSDSPFKAGIFKGKTALVTGGGSGIGFEIARQFGLHGAKVSLMGRREGPIATAVKALRSESVEAFGYTGDIREAGDCARVVRDTVSRCGSLDILVNCAAGNFLTPAEDLSKKGFQTVLDIDAVGTFAMSTAAFLELR